MWYEVLSEEFLWWLCLLSILIPWYLLWMIGIDWIVREITHKKGVEDIEVREDRKDIEKRSVPHSIPRDNETISECSTLPGGGIRYLWSSDSRKPNSDKGKMGDDSE